MSPRERRRRQRVPRRAEDDAYRRRSRRQRRRQRARQRRRIAILAAIAVVIVAGIAAAGITGAATVGPRCDLDRLRPVEIGQNSFVYAADGSLLGSIPAEKNRQPVALHRISKWMRLSTIAIEDRRFYEHSGIDVEGIARALAADVQAGRVVEGGSTITQQLVRNLFISREVTFERKLIEACLAVRLNNRRSKQWILESYLNTVYYGNHAYGVQAAAQTYFSKPTWKLTLGQAALLAGLTQAPPEPGAAGDARERGHHEATVRRGGRRPRAAPASRQGLYPHPRALLLQLRPRTADHAVRRQHRALRRPSRLYDDRPAFPAAGAECHPPHPSLPGRPRRCDRLDQSGERRDSRDGGGDSRPPRQPVQPRVAGAPPGGLDLQDVRPHCRDQRGGRPGLDELQLALLRLPARPALEAVGGLDLRPLLSGLRLDPPRDALLRQHRLRAVDPRPRAGEGRSDGAPARRALEPEDEGGRLRAVARPRLRRHLASGHGLGLRDARGRRHLFGADGDSEGRPAGRHRRHRRRLGQAATSPRDSRLGRGRGDEDPRGQHRRGHGHRRRSLLRPPGCGEDRHDRRPHRRLVLRLHADALDDGLGRVPARTRADGERPRDLRRGRHLPGHDLEPVHALGDRSNRARRLPGASLLAGVATVRARAVRERVRRRQPAVLLPAVALALPQPNAPAPPAAP